MTDQPEHERVRLIDEIEFNELKSRVEAIEGKIQRIVEIIESVARRKYNL